VGLPVYRRCRRCKTLFRDEELKRDERGRLTCPKCGFFLFNLVNLETRVKREEVGVKRVRVARPVVDIGIESVGWSSGVRTKAKPSGGGKLLKTLLSDLEVDWKPVSKRSGALKQGS